MHTTASDEDPLCAQTEQEFNGSEAISVATPEQALGVTVNKAEPGDRSEQIIEPADQRRSRAAPFSTSGKGIRRTTYWVGDKPISLAYIPALADEHPETITHEPRKPT